MKTRLVICLFFTLGTVALLPAMAARDPFWPIGYEPPKPDQTNAVTVAKPLETPNTVEKPITDADWALARKALLISGFTQTVRPDTRETRVQAMVNRRMVSAGDTVTCIYQEVHYLWRVETIIDRTIQLVPLKAERVGQKPTDVKPTL